MRHESCVALSDGSTIPCILPARRHWSFQCGGFWQRLFTLYLLASRSAVERLHFALRELAERTWRHVEHQSAIADAADLLDVVADFFKHLAKLAVASFGECDLVPRVLTTANLLDLCRLGEHAVAAAFADFVEASTINHDATAQLRDGFVGRSAGDFYQVRFLDAGGGLGQTIGEVAIVGHQKQALAEVIEATDGIEPRHFAVLAGDFLLRLLAKEFHDGWAAFGVVERGDVAARLVDHEVALRLRAGEALAVDLDVVVRRVGAGAEFGDDLAVDLNAAVEDDLLGGAARGDAGLREDFLQAVAAWFVFFYLLHLIIIAFAADPTLKIAIATYSVDLLALRACSANTGVSPLRGCAALVEMTGV